MENIRKCIVCGIEASQFCSQCKLVRYCGEEHQRKHWKQHKLECRPFSVSTAQDIGRYLLATRDIKAKTVIFSESPLVVGPKWYLNEREECRPIVPCVGCYIPVRVGGHFCPRCRWPTCSEACDGLSNSKLHGLECGILGLGNGPSDINDLNSIMDYYRIDALVVLKCLLLQVKYPKKWKELLDMQSHEAERIDSELYRDAEKRVVSYLLNNYFNRLKCLENKSNHKILSDYDASTLHKICGIIETNYMCITLPNGLELSGLYYTACMMEHSCVPNCYFTFDHNNGFKISVTAGRDIKKGEHIQIMYSNMLWGTQIRQEHLELTKHFLCKCERCSDKTELGTKLSGLKCMGPEGAPCEGIQLPENPLNQKTEWACNKCEMKISSEEVRYIMSQMNEEVENLLSKTPTVHQLESLIDKLSQFLHTNHYHLFNLKHSLLQLYGHDQSEQLSDELLTKKISMSEDLLAICDKLDPYTIRLSLYVVIILNEWHSALVECGKRQITKDGQGKENATDHFKKAHDLLVRAKNVLQKDLDTVGGSKLNETITKSICNIEKLINSET